nr:NIF family HAD-type phosphatase [Stenotrophomonas rhizophila]
MHKAPACEQCVLSTSAGRDALMRPTVLALDLEGTLISNAISQIPRPGLRRFLEEVRSEFERLVLFTTVPKDRVRAIATLLEKRGKRSRVVPRASVH